MNLEYLEFQKYPWKDTSTR